MQQPSENAVSFINQLLKENKKLCVYHYSFNGVSKSRFFVKGSYSGQEVLISLNHMMCRKHTNTLSVEMFVSQN